METIFNLNSDDMEIVTFNVRFISDRKERPSFRRFGKLYVDSYAKFCNRHDMFWVEVSLDGKDLGAVSIDPILIAPEDFYVNRNHCKVQESQFYEELKPMIEAWFVTQPEYQQQIRWNAILIENYRKDKESGFVTCLASELTE